MEVGSLESLSHPAPRIIAASVEGKKLFVFGEDFDVGAVILLNGDQQATLTTLGTRRPC